MHFLSYILLLLKDLKWGGDVQGTGGPVSKTSAVRDQKVSLFATRKGLKSLPEIQPTPNLFLLMSNQNIETTEKKNIGNVHKIYSSVKLKLRTLIY